MHVKRIMFRRPLLLPQSPSVGLEHIDDTEIEITEVGIQLGDVLIPWHAVDFIAGLPCANNQAPKTSLQSLPPEPRPAASKATKGAGSRPKI